MKESYMNYITFTRQYSERTIHWYEKSLKKFDEFLATIGKNIDDPEAIKLVDIYNYMEDLARSGLTARTCAWYIDWVRGYLKYCKNVAELDILDVHKIKSPKIPEKQIWFFSKEEKQHILKVFKRGVWTKPLTQLRNRLLTVMLMQTWLRCHELAKIKLIDISWESLQIIGKWGVRRFVYLRPEVRELMYQYLGKRKKKSDYLFDWSKGSHLTTDRIRRIYSNLSKEIWIHVHAHKFRHTFATDLLHIPWANIYAVMKLLWHKRITTTQIYLGCDNQELKKLQFWLEY